MNRTTITIAALLGLTALTGCNVVPQQLDYLAPDEGPAIYVPTAVVVEGPGDTSPVIVAVSTDCEGVYQRDTDGRPVTEGPKSTPVPCAPQTAPSGLPAGTTCEGDYLVTDDGFVAEGAAAVQVPC